jgi:hypothetical protein
MISNDAIHVQIEGEDGNVEGITTTNHDHLKGPT